MKNKKTSTKQEISYQTLLLDVKKLHSNNGQVEGLPKNPRFIRDERFEALKKSISDAPEMLELRELIVYDNKGKYVVVGGNMRLKALIDLGVKKVKCKVLAENTPIDKLREYAIKDNIAFGADDWGLLEDEWSIEELEDWGVEFKEETDPVDAIMDYNNDLPEELQGLDLTPDKLDKINGNDETLMERVIIVFPTDMKHKMAQLLGIENVSKVVYKIEELLK